MNHEGGVCSYTDRNFSSYVYCFTNQCIAIKRNRYSFSSQCGRVLGICSNFVYGVGRFELKRAQTKPMPLLTS